MRTATLFALLSMPLSAGSISIVNNCAGNAECTVEGGAGGFGTTVFSADLTVMADNSSNWGDAGPGGSGSVTIDETGKTEGPVRPGYIEFFSYGPTGIASSGESSADASFTVGDITGSVPGEVGVPTPIAGQFLPFTLGVPFEITASAYIDVPRAPPGSQYADADLYFSFSLFESGPGPSPDESSAVIIEDPPSPVPEPGSFGVAALALVLLAGLRAAHARRLSQ